METDLSFKIRCKCAVMYVYEFLGNLAVNSTLIIEFKKINWKI